MLARVITRVSTGVFTVTAFGAAAKIVSPDKLGSALGTIILGFSCAMILGVPIGIWVSGWLNWKAIFVILGLFSLIITFFIFKLIPEIAGDAPVSFLQQFKVLGNVVILSGLFISLFRESANSILFTYIVPFMHDMLQINMSSVSLVMLVFGVFGAIGSRIGGYGVDKWGASRVILMSIIINIVVVTLLPLCTKSNALSLLLISGMVLSMFLAGPAIQSYFIQKAPESSNLVLSINTSIIHLGLAIGAGTGGYVLKSTSTLIYHPWATSIILILGLVTAWISFSYARKAKSLQTKEGSS